MDLSDLNDTFSGDVIVKFSTINYFHFHNACAYGIMGWRRVQGLCATPSFTEEGWVCISHMVCKCIAYAKLYF